jgi:DNA polymerase-1
MTRCREVAEAYAIPVLQRDGFEADDLIATCIEHARKHGLVTVVCSGDKDLLQLVAPDVIVWDAMHQRVYGRDEVVEKWGVPPERVRDLLALMGDSSDNVPGVDHVGEKTAAKLLNGVRLPRRGVQERRQGEGQDPKEYLQKLHEANARLSLRARGPEARRPHGLRPRRPRVRRLEQGKLKPSSSTSTSTSWPTPWTPAAAVVAARPKTATYESRAHRRGPRRGHRRVPRGKWFAVDTETTSLDTYTAELVGVSLSWKPGHGVYIPIGHRVLGDPTQLDRAAVLDALRPLFADASVRKGGQNIKYDDMVLRRAGVPVRGYDFDTMIASYLIDPERHSHKLDEISPLRARLRDGDLRAVTKQGKGKQVTFDQVDIATRHPLLRRGRRGGVAPRRAPAPAAGARGSGSSCATSSSPCRTCSGAWRSAASCSTGPS